MLTTERLVLTIPGALAASARDFDPGFWRETLDRQARRRRCGPAAANYMPHNRRSAAVLERLGFTIEGTAKNYLYLAGAWQDHVLTSLTNPRPIVPGAAS